ncbi:MAG: hypothetical protein JJ714_03640 [Acidithiobacillus sp.]|nr:hypothetical protein [Acidithiobacillus sp.]
MSEIKVIHTSPSARRALAHLWVAVRTLTDAALTDDDMAILAEALDDLRVILEGAKNE